MAPEMKIDETVLPATARIVEFNPHDLIAIGCVVVAVLLVLIITMIKPSR